MTTCPDDNALAQLVDGTHGDRETIERHLDACDTCTNLVAELAWVVAPPRSAPPGYRLVRAIDDATWEAIDKTNRRVALGFAPKLDARLASIRHPNVVEIYEMGTLDDEHFIATELIETSAMGAPIDVWQRALAGLAALHRAGIVHGHVSPEHVFVVGDRVLVGGFTTRLARTSGYLAPEQLAGEPATHKSDQLNACISIFEALVGSKPFAGATPGALAVVMSSPPEPPRDLDRRLYAVLVRGMAADPAKRWPDIDALAAAIARPPRSRAPLVVTVAVVVLAALALALLAR